MLLFNLGEKLDDKFNLEFDGEEFWVIVMSDGIFWVLFMRKFLVLKVFVIVKNLFFIFIFFVLCSFEVGVVLVMCWVWWWGWGLLVLDCFLGGRICIGDVCVFLDMVCFCCENVLFFIKLVVGFWVGCIVILFGVRWCCLWCCVRVLVECICVLYLL